VWQGCWSAGQPDMDFVNFSLTNRILLTAKLITDWEMNTNATRSVLPLDSMFKNFFIAN
jgi:hypothetical protein